MFNRSLHHRHLEGRSLDILPDGLNQTSNSRKMSPNYNLPFVMNSIDKVGLMGWHNLVNGIEIEFQRQAIEFLRVDLICKKLPGSNMGTDIFVKADAL